jgi:8-oxo-dGTP pyrophosphatase MutT (NUDIX family)
MPDRTAERIIQIASSFPNSSVVNDFINRAKEEKLTRDENPKSHLCVYFAGYDKDTKRVFIGHHKKSGLYLFNGGHIDEGEIPEEALEREMGEEWGIKIKLEDIGEPKLLTITPIDNPTKLKCKKHFDVWFFVPLSESTFKPDQDLLATEFHKTMWVSIDEARKLITDESTLLAIDEFEKIFNNEIFWKHQAKTGL